MINPFKTTISINSMDDKRDIKYQILKALTVVEATDDTIKFNLSSDKYVPVKGDRLWFYPGCDIPRFKVKQFCQKHDVAVVKYKDKSTVRFIGPDVTKAMIDWRWRSYMGKTEFLTWFDTVICNAWEQLKADIISSESDIVYLNYDALNKFTSEAEFGKKKLDSEFKVSNNLVWAKDEKSYEHIVYMTNDPNLKYQDDLLSLLNTGTIMDEKMFTEIQRLFKSSDTENTKLAMESMANCDFQKSAVYLLLLMQAYGSEMYNSGTRHHVNFKSLLKYFQIGNINSIDLNQIIDSLMHQKLLNVTNLNVLMPMALEYIQEYGDLKHITVINVGLSPEAEASIAENILDKKDEPIDAETTIEPTLDTAPGAFT